jgi:hypothetical protein
MGDLPPVTCAAKRQSTHTPHGSQGVTTLPDNLAQQGVIRERDE